MVERSGKFCITTFFCTNLIILPAPPWLKPPIGNGSFNLSHNSFSTVTDIEEVQSIPTPPLAVPNEMVKGQELLQSQSVLCFHVPGLGYCNTNMDHFILGTGLPSPTTEKKMVRCRRGLKKQEQAKGCTNDSKV